MGKIKYLLQRMRRMDYRAMWKTARMLHEKTGRATLGLLLDMGRCAFQYGAGYMDYKIAEMYRLTPAQRATQITRAASNRIVARMNDKAYWHFFDNKAEFNTLFAEQVRRDWLDLRDATQNDLDAWGRRSRRRHWKTAGRLQRPGHRQIQPGPDSASAGHPRAGHRFAGALRRAASRACGAVPHLRQHASHRDAAGR